MPWERFDDPKALIRAIEAFIRVGAARGQQRTAKTRPKTLLALPNFGGGHGGARHQRGELMRVLLETAERCAREHDLDVALVFVSAEPYALAQHLRRQGGAAQWAELDAESLGEAERLAKLAASKQLVPFLGAGVSVSAGGPSWDGLIETLKQHVAPGDELSHALSTSKWGALDRAAALRAIYDAQRPSSAASFNELVASAVTLRRYGLALPLIAALESTEAITLNYDELFERAAQAASVAFRVLPGGTSVGSDRWLLKLHGTVARPETIVLTRDDYLGFDEDRGALTALVKATMMTRHLLFVGFGLTDDHFHQILYDVRRAVRAHDADAHLEATVLKLGPKDPLVEAVWGKDLTVVPIGETPSGAAPLQAARLLEIFLDRVLCLSARSYRYLLAEHFEGGLSAAERDLRDRLRALARDVPDEVRATEAWHRLSETLESFGWKPSD